MLAFFALIAAPSFGQIKYGGGLTLGTKVSINDDEEETLGFGIQLRGDYTINEKWSVAPNFIYFFPSVPNGIDYSLWQLNADAHYKFSETDQFQFYGLAGLNYSYAKAEVDLGTYGTVSSDDSKIGLNLGIGAQRGNLFGELKYDTAIEQLAISVGILFGGE